MTRGALQRLAAVDAENCRLLKIATWFHARGERAAATLALHIAMFRDLERRRGRLTR